MIPIGQAFVYKTRAAKALESTLKGFRIEWIESVDRDGMPLRGLPIWWETSGATEKPASLNNRNE
jgi:hypothetical protein